MSLEGMLIAHTDSGLYLNVLDKNSIPLRCKSYARHGNVLFVQDEGNCTYLYDVKNRKVSRRIKFNDIKEVKIGEGNIGFVLEYTKELYILKLRSPHLELSEDDLFNFEEKGESGGKICISALDPSENDGAVEFFKKLENVEKFSVAEKFLGTFCKGNLKFYDMSQDYKEILNIQGVKNYVQHKDLVLFIQRKSNGTEKFSFKILNGEGVLFEIGFENLEAFESKLSPDGKYIMALMTTEYVNNSYYGTRELYIFCVETRKYKKFSFSPVLDYNFTKKGFMVCHGNQPSTITHFDMNKNIHVYAKAIRNRFNYNENTGMMCHSGIDSLAGNLEIISANEEVFFSTKILGLSKTIWSPSGTYMCAAVTSALKVDNKINIYDYYGHLLFSKEFKELHDVDWIGEGTFKKLEAPEKKNIKVEEAYVPPHRLMQKPKVKRVVPQALPKKKQETQAEIENKLRLIKNIKKKENPSIEELNLLLKEENLKEKLKKFQSTTNT